MPSLPSVDAPDTTIARPAPPSPAVKRSRNWTLSLTCSLIALGLAWELWLAPTGRGTLAIKVLPLVLALVGLARYRLYTFRWLSLLVWLYAAEGASRASTEAGWSRPLAVVELLLAVALFACCSWHVRARLGAGRAAAAGMSAIAPGTASGNAAATAAHTTAPAPAPSA